jgi:ketosteroid isomerase-like protein
MKNTMQFGLFFAVFSLAATTTFLQAQDLNNEVAEFTQTWQDAYNRADHAALTTFYADEVVILNPVDGTQATLTKELVGSNFANDFRANTLQIEIKTTTITLLSDGKVNTTGTYSVTGTDKKSGEKIDSSGTFDNISLKEGGKWKICQSKVTAK